MKPAPFDYHRPSGLQEALELSSSHGEDAKVLAGGQSLVPMLNFRLARPAHVIDINRLDELAHIRRADGILRIGALARQSVLEASPLVARDWPLLTGAVRWVGHPQIRNRGTVGGSVAHADPAAELPLALATLEATFVARSARGSRELGWREFFVTHLTTALEPDELLVEIHVPAPAAGTTWGFAEYARRHGDFALGGAAALLRMEDGVCRDARVGLLAAGDTPRRAQAAEDLLVGSFVDAQAIEEAGQQAIVDVHPTGDIHGSGEYRRQLITAMVQRALTDAVERAREVETR